MHDSRISILLATGVLLALAPSPVRAQVSFDSYYAVGDSLAAGVSSASLVETHQRFSMPALVARQASIPQFQLPLVSTPGLPPELELASLFPAVIVPSSVIPGAPLNLGLTRPYNDVAVPGATVEDALSRQTDEGGFHDLILRGLGSQVEQVVGAQPTLVTVWIGNNDVLGAVVRGRAVEGETLTPVDAFRQSYGEVIAALQGTGAAVVAANLPDVTRIPFATAIPRVLLDPLTGKPVEIDGQQVPLWGPEGPLPEGSLVTLAASSLLAQGVGVPQTLGGNARIAEGRCKGCLPDEVVLDPGEVAAIRARVDDDNAVIEQVCQAAGVPVVDVHGLVDSLAGPGVQVGGVTFTADFLTGGVYSYDGIHPTDLGNALITNEWIHAIDGLGGDLAEIDLLPFMGLSTQSVHRSASLTPEAYANLLRFFPRLDRR